MLSGEMQVPVWLGLVLLVLAVTGGYAVLCAARDGWEWLHDEDWGEEYEEDYLPPERSWEELTSEQPVLEGVLWEPPGFARDNPRMYAPAGEWLSATGERLMPAWQSEILAARAWWEELPSGTGFTRAMARQVEELAG